ncbi:DDE-type integrase/transposase/recombinase [Nocardia sp. NBC_01730]|uniref:DDE-type integrase/transposase/recombinase n=1 Tax=Nocardia sp. NBC_01730 TaxID=2975998 RepID=UPI003FA36708
MIDAAVDELDPLVGVTAACRLTGKSRATLYRHRNPTPPKHGPRRPVLHPAALTTAEEAAVLAQLRSDRFVEKSPAQVWAILLDEGTYLCSISTMYRLLRTHNEVRERRRQATHPARTKPELVARGPNQVWSWDATKLTGPFKGIYYTLLVMLDIFSRKAVHWTVVPSESRWIAKQFQLDSIAANDGIMPGYIHADNGGPMTSQPVSELLIDLGSTRSHSRPRTSNDNLQRSEFQDPEVLPGVPATVRLDQRGTAVLRGVLYLLQHPAPPLWDRITHSRNGSRRHRRSHPHPASRGTHRRLHRQPGPIPASTDTTQAAESSLDQRTSEGEHRHRIRSLNRLIRFDSYRNARPRARLTRKHRLQRGPYRHTWIHWIQRVEVR